MLEPVAKPLILGILRVVKQSLMKERRNQTMATSSFNKIFVVSSPEGIKKLEEVMSSEPEPIKRNPNLAEEKKRTEDLVNQWLSSWEHSSDE